MVKKIGPAILIIIINILFLSMNFGGQEVQAGIDERIRWSPRVQHSTVVLPNGSIILMGGFLPGDSSISPEQFGDVWISRGSDPSSWHRVRALAEWGPRFGHASLLLSDGSIIVMGGSRYDTDGELVFLNDIWQSFDQGRSWNRVTRSAGWSPRSLIAAVATPGRDILISGGEATDREFLSDAWRLSNSGGAWSDITNHNATEWYSPRAGHHILALPDDSFLLMGGFDYDKKQANQPNDVWRSHDGGASWTNISGNALEEPRAFNDILQIDGKLFNLGGVTSTVERLPWHQRAWNWVTFRGYKNRELVFNVSNTVSSSSDQGLTWQREEPVGDIWIGCSGHSSVAHPDGSFIVMGGQTADAITNDVWRGTPLPGNKIEWEELAPPLDYVARDYDFFDPAQERDEEYTIIYLRNENEFNVMAWFMDASGYNILTFNYLSHSTRPEERIAAVGDIDKDGTSDLIIEDIVTGERSVWFMKENGVTRNDRVNLDPSREELKWSIAAVENILGTGDGYPQLIWENTVEGHRGLWLMGGDDGTERKGTKRFVPLVVSPEYRVAALADLNGNGIKDIIFENHRTGQRYVWLMNEQGYVLKEMAGMSDKGSEWRIRGAADVTGDLFDELYAQNINTGACELWLVDIFENDDEDAEYPWVAELTRSFPLNHGSMSSAWVIVGVSRFSGTPSGSPNLPTTLVRPREFSVDVVADQESPQEPGVDINIIASSTDIDTPEYRFHLRGPESNEWSMVQDYSLADTYLWTPTAEGTYRFSVWARHSGSSAEWEAYNTDLYFTIAAEEEDEEDYRVDSVKVSTNRTSPQEPGETITVTASSTGSPTPEYRFYIRAPGSSDWQMVRDYNRDNNYRWRPSVEGTYRFSVWARHSGSSAEWEAYNTDLFFTIAAEEEVVEEYRVETLKISTDRTSPRETGETITVTASSTGSPTPEYRFYIRAPGSSDWQMVRDYNRDNNYRWRPSVEGTYRFSVWARHSGSSADWEAYNTDLYFTIVSAKEPEKPPVVEVSVILIPDRDSPQQVGVPITLKAESTGFTKPLYSFWVEQDKTWHMIQDFGTEAWCPWTPKEVGYYQIRVWVKESGSTAEFDAEDGMPYQITESKIDFRAPLIKPNF